MNLLTTEKLGLTRISILAILRLNEEATIFYHDMHCTNYAPLVHLLLPVGAGGQMPVFTGWAIKVNPAFLA